MWKSKLRWGLLAALVLVASTTVSLPAEDADDWPTFKHCVEDGSVYVASNCEDREHRLYVPVFAAVGGGKDKPLGDLSEPCRMPGTKCTDSLLPPAIEWGIGHVDKNVPLQVFHQRLPVRFADNAQTPPLSQWVTDEIKKLASRFQEFELAWRLGADSTTEPVLLLPVGTAEEADWQGLGTCRSLEIGRIKIAGRKEDVVLESKCQVDEARGTSSFVWRLREDPLPVPQDLSVTEVKIELFPSRGGFFQKLPRFNTRSRVIPDERGANHLVHLTTTFTGKAAVVTGGNTGDRESNVPWWAAPAAVGLTGLITVLVVHALRRGPAKAQRAAQATAPVRPLAAPGAQPGAPPAGWKWLNWLRSLKLRVSLRRRKRDDAAGEKPPVPVDLGDGAVDSYANVVDGPDVADADDTVDIVEAALPPPEPQRQGKNNKKKDNGHDYIAPTTSIQPRTQDIVKGVLGDERFRKLVASETKSLLQSQSVLSELAGHQFIQAAVQKQAASIIKKEVRIDDLAARIASSAPVQDTVNDLCTQFKQTITRSFEQQSQALLAKSRESWAADTAEALLAHAMKAEWPDEPPRQQLPPPQTPLSAPREAVRAIKSLQDLVLFFAQLYRAWCEQGGPFEQLAAASAALTQHHEAGKLTSERERLRELHERAVRTLQSVLLIDAPLINALAVAASGGTPPSSVFLDVARRRWPSSLSTTQDVAKFVNEWCRLRLPLLQLTIEAMPRELGVASKDAGGLKRALESVNLAHSQIGNFAGDLDLSIEGTAVMFHALVDELYKSINVRYFPIRLYQDDLDSRHVVLAMQHTGTIGDVKYGRLLVALGLVRRHGIVVSVRQPLIQLQDPGATSDRWEGLLEYRTCHAAGNDMTTWRPRTEDDRRNALRRGLSALGNAEDGLQPFQALLMTADYPWMHLPVHIPEAAVEMLTDMGVPPRLGGGTHVLTADVVTFCCMPLDSARVTAKERIERAARQWQERLAQLRRDLAQESLGIWQIPFLRVLLDDEDPQDWVSTGSLELSAGDLLENAKGRGGARLEKMKGSVEIDYLRRPFITWPAVADGRHQTITGSQRTLTFERPMLEITGFPMNY